MSDQSFQGLYWNQCSQNEFLALIPGMLYRPSCTVCPFEKLCTTGAMTVSVHKHMVKLYNCTDPTIGLQTLACKNHVTTNETINYSFLNLHINAVLWFNTIENKDCKHNFKWPSMRRWQCPIYNGTLNSFVWSKLNIEEVLF